ncbi:2S seed storage protein 3 [Raphanus sativus]|nr:2S seed storage protein 3 [Raphanus sativus]KAJ4869058.1 2S seed storage protein 3 [Raphanus sativus]
MATKLFLVCATLAFCVLLTNASIYRTVVELDDDTNPFACQRWIRQQLAGSPFSENQWGPQQGPSLRQQCCNELYQEDQECVCPTLKQAAKAVRMQGQHGPIQSTRIYKIAKNLPNVCNMQRIGTCPFIAIPFFPPY